MGNGRTLQDGVRFRTILEALFVILLLLQSAGQSPAPPLIQNRT